MDTTRNCRWPTLLAVVVSLLAGPASQADVVTDWSIKSADIVVAAEVPAAAAYRVMASVQSAVYEAVNAITLRYPPGRVTGDAASGASVEAAVIAASRAVLQKLVPSARVSIDAACATSLSAVPDGSAKTAGIQVGERAAAAVLAWRVDDDANVPEDYRPRTSPGVYVPTVIPDASGWFRRKPWVMTSPDQFRPGPPPSLTSERWARDCNEVRDLGAKNSPRRSAEQTAMARFWNASGPMLYYPVVWSVTRGPGRELTQNARLLALAGQAMDDGVIAAFEAKYHYEFWRPITAIRNGDTDGNRATQRDPSWTPFIETPMHPEYPCAHCVVAGVVGAVLEAEIGAGPTPVLTTSRAGADGVERRWTRLDDFVQEVEDARVCGGVHYRNSTEVGTTMGRKVGALAVAKFPRPRE